MLQMRINSNRISVGSLAWFPTNLATALFSTKSKKQLFPHQQIEYWLNILKWNVLKSQLNLAYTNIKFCSQKKTCFFLAIQELPTLASQHPHLLLRRAVLHAQRDNKVNFFKKAKQFLTHFEFRSWSWSDFVDCYCRYTYTHKHTWLALNQILQIRNQVSESCRNLSQNIFNQSIVKCEFPGLSLEIIDFSCVYKLFC